VAAERLLLGFSAAAAIVGAVASGCSSSSSPAAQQDSGVADVTMESMPEPEAAPEAEPDVADTGLDGMGTGPDVCVPDTSVSALPVGDAALNDAGATAASCMMCVTQSPACSQVVGECNESCVCIQLFQNFATCLSSPGGSLIACQAALQGLAAAGVDAGTIACEASCATACGYTPPSGDGGDGSTTTEGGD
jgi:hypothetical protein